jgi:hypothetical protein
MVKLFYCWVAMCSMLPNDLKVQVSDTTMMIKDLKLVKRNFLRLLLIQLSDK